MIRPCHTYSIAAVDPQAGEMGAAVQSHWFSVGSVVPWAEDPGRELRQAAVLDARGGAAAHTGTRCVPEAGHGRSL